ncbi:MAG: CrcB family protein, partial [Alphaproteobacteria bacterium]
AFTTFSTFSLDVVTMYERDALLLVGVYVVVSVVASIGALLVGLRLARVVA